MRNGMLYPHNVLEGFGNGAILDLRVRMANDFIKSPWLQTLYPGTPVKEIATLALNLAEEITAQAAELGWLTPLPEGGELPQWLRDQAKVTASYQVCQQLEGQRFAQGEQGKVVPAAPGVMDPRKH